MHVVFSALSQNYNGAVRVSVQHNTKLHSAVPNLHSVVSSNICFALARLTSVTRILGGGAPWDRPIGEVGEEKGKVDGVIHG